MSLRDIKLELGYRGGNLGERVIIPCMSQSKSVDAVSAYFTLGGLKSVAIGLDTLYESGGTFRIVMSIQDAKRSDFVRVLKTEDQLKECILSISQQIKEDALKVSEALERKSLATLGWMMKSGLLKIKVAAIKSIDGIESTSSMFHEKGYIFRDSDNNGVAADGSMNFTENGMGWNSENLRVFKTWHSPDYYNLSVEYFETVWCGRDDRLIVRDIDKNIVEEIAEVLINLYVNNRLNPIPSIVALLRGSPEFARFNTTQVALFPHQERALCNAMSRSPVRVIFSDDVGLGKTIEAGAALHYGLKFLGWKKVIILVPAGLVVQWIGELKDKIGINAQRLDNETSTFKDSTEMESQLADEPWESGVFIVSAQLVSRSKKYSDIFEREVISADCLMLDEAHSARRKVDNAGGMEETLIYTMLAKFAHKVPNLMLLTATPMQSQHEELVGLLEQIGLPDQWKRPDFFKDYHELLRKNEFDPNDATILDAGLRATKIVNSSIASINSYELCSTPADFKHAVITSAITPLIVIRNTRNALKKIGYNFPDRIVLPSGIEMSPDAKSAYDLIEYYLDNYFGMTEKVLFYGENAMGFLYATYFQRIVSSFNSAYSTLSRRRNKLKNWLDNNFNNIGGEDEESEDDDSSSFKRRILSENDKKIAGIKCRQELSSLDNIITALAQFSGKNAYADPKLAKLDEIVVKLLESDDAFLIFSKYTDTTSAVVELLNPRFIKQNTQFAYYSGSECWISVNGVKSVSNKYQIVTLLKTGQLKAIICTDAASEGLNLQTACHLINVDVPWNPARLEQRFGRIDRLGQKATQVIFYNLWYPGSIEERMYSAILTRGAAIGFAIGVMSETVGRSIRTQLVGNTPAASIDIENSLEQIRNLQDRLNLESIERTFSGRLETDTLAESFRKLLLKLSKYLSPGTLSGSSNFVSDLSDSRGDGVTVYSFPFESLPLSPADRNTAELFLVERNNLPICLMLSTTNHSYLLGVMDTMNCLLSIVTGSPFTTSLSPDFEGKLVDTIDIERILNKRFPGRVDATALDFSRFINCNNTNINLKSFKPSCRFIGHVKVED